MDQAIIEVEVLKYWHCFKIHGIAPKKYLVLKSMELLQYKIKSSTSI